MGADTQCDRSRIDASRSASAWGGLLSGVGGGGLASCEERSWSSSLIAAFSWALVESVRVTPLSSCETVLGGSFGVRYSDS